MIFIIRLPSFSDRLFASIMKEFKKTKDILKMTVIVNTFAMLLTFEEPIKSQCLGVLLTLLNHSFPKIRRAAADELYMRMLVDEHILQPVRVVSAMSILSETRWEIDSLQSLVQKRDELCKALNISPNDSKLRDLTIQLLEKPPTTQSQSPSKNQS